MSKVDKNDIGATLADLAIAAYQSLKGNNFSSFKCYVQRAVAELTIIEYHFRDLNGTKGTINVELISTILLAAKPEKPEQKVSRIWLEDFGICNASTPRIINISLAKREDFSGQCPLKFYYGERLDATAAVIQPPDKGKATLVFDPSSVAGTKLFEYKFQSLEQMDDAFEHAVAFLSHLKSRS